MSVSTPYRSRRTPFAVGYGTNTGRCRRAGCSEIGRVGNAGFCRADWIRVPEDLQVRWKEARDGGDDPYELQSAQQAIDEYLNE